MTWWLAVPSAPNDYGMIPCDVAQAAPTDKSMVPSNSVSNTHLWYGAALWFSQHQIIRNEKQGALQVHQHQTSRDYGLVPCSYISTKSAEIMAWCLAVTSASKDFGTVSYGSVGTK